MKQLQTEAILLKRLNFSEADRILTVITPNHGKISVIAKGVRRAKSKLAGGLELFSISEITYIEGKSELKTIVSTRLKVHFKNIVSDVNRTMIGYDFMKSVDSLTQHTDEPAYYELLAVGLEALDKTSVSSTVIETWFYTRTLLISGSAINIEKPLKSDSFEEDKRYNFSYDEMSFFEYQDGLFGPQHIKFLRLVARSQKPEQLLSVIGCVELSEELKGVIKQSATMHKA